jgi:hypothetical protein
MTAQEIFDRVWTHFVTNDGPLSIGEDGECRYRGPNGARCAVGLLIPDDEYTSALDEGETIVSRVINRKNCPPSLRALAEHPKLLSSLQNAHDSAAFGNEEIGAGLRRVAEIYELTIPEVFP